MEVPLNKKIYFLSDFHLGAPNAAESRIREKKIIQFLNEIKENAAQIFIVGLKQFQMPEVAKGKSGQKVG